MIAITIRLDKDDEIYFDFVKKQFNLKNNSEVLRLALKLTYDSFNEEKDEDKIVDTPDREDESPILIEQYLKGEETYEDLLNYCETSGQKMPQFIIDRENEKRQLAAI